MSLRAKVLGVLGLLVLMAVVEGGLVYLLQRDVRTAAAEVERTTNLRLAHGRMWRALLRMESAERAYLLAGEHSLLAEYETARQDYERDLAEIKARTFDPGQRDRVRRVEALVTRWQPTRHPDSAERRAPPEARAERAGELAARFLPVQDALQGIIAGENERLAAAQASSRAQVRSATLVLMIIPIAGPLMLAGLIIAAQRRLLAPIGTLAAAMRQTPHGQIVVPAFAERNDEISALFRGFRDMARAVAEREAEAAPGIRHEQAGSAGLGDLSARVEAAHTELRQIIDTVPAALVMFDAEGRISMMNRASVSVLGDFTKTAEAQAAFRSSYTLNDRNGHRLAPHQYPSARALRGERVEGLEIEIQTLDRHTLPILASAAPLRGHGGEVLGAVVGFQDITRIRDVDRLKDEFVSTVSHELRTPLTSILGSLQLVLDDRDAVADDDHRQLLHVALANCERLIRIINDILDVSKIEAGRIQLQRRAVSVETLIRLSIPNVEQIARTGRITLATDAFDDLPLVFADPDRFVQALVNLLSNAVKFSPAGTTVRITAATRGPVVAITVKDQGPGIPPEHMDRLFQKFQQLDSSASRRAGGTGLGLAITKAIVEQHGGRITVQSALGAGTSFTVTVPIAPPATTSAARGEAPLSRAGSSRRRVLLVDDDRALRDVVRRQLELAGYEVVEAADGQRAVALAHTHTPDVIALDLMMPGHDGWTAIRELTADPATAHIPIIVVSGLDDAARQISETMPLVRKPLDGNLLLREIRRVLGDREHARVLVAEDDDDLRRILSQTLRRRGYDVHQARDGREAIAIYEREPIDLVVLDLRMPDVDGFEVIRRLRDMRGGAEVPIVVVSGSDTGDSQLRSLRLGANVYLTKPLNADGLLAEVGRLLNR